MEIVDFYAGCSFRDGQYLMDTDVIPDLKAKYPHLQLEYRMLKVYDVPESQLAQHLETWENVLEDGFEAGLSACRVG
ncbi:MAG: hypothetical protein V8S95_02795 [Odoribacter sp.]